ncbi:MAG: hypothetical protein M3Z09_12060 [Acidobacteriota bacterium]|nr:hypothetical protein [Acidobacteriota bacterium]
MTVGYFSPLPPAPTGVADYAASLLTELQRHGNIEISPDTCDVALYHIGNNQLHRSIYDRAIQHPGVVVLHDAVLHHFFLGSFRKNDYIAEFVYNYGEWARDEAGELWRERSLSAQDPRYFGRPMLKRIAARSLAVVVHNPAAARMVRDHSPTTPVVEIPHFYTPAPPADPAEVARFRASLHGPGPIGFVFIFLGYLRESKRLMPVLQAFERLHRLRPGTRLLVAGEFVSRDLARNAAALLGQPGVTCLSHLPEKEFAIAAAAADCCINLRYPAAGESSGIAVRLMGLGKPVLLTEAEETARIPELASFRIFPGAAEKASLFDTMFLVSEYPDLARRAGREAALHIERYHSLASAGKRYWDLLCHTAALRSFSLSPV